MKLSRRKQALFVLAFVVGLFSFFLVRPSVPEISGRVMLQGTPRPEIQIALDNLSAQLRPDGLKTRHYVSSNGGLGNVFVWIRAGLTNHFVAASAAPVVMDFKGSQLEPYMVALMTNQAMHLRNLDPYLHNAHVMPRARGNRDRNVAMATRTSLVVEAWYQALYRRYVLRRPAPVNGSPFIFSGAEPLIRLKCDVHPWEFGYICVSDHPFFAVTDAEGRFAFPSGLPPGRYLIEARHLKAGSVTQEVVIARGERKHLELSLRVP